MVNTPEDTVASSSGIGGFAQPIADDRVALASLSGLALAGGLVVARAPSGARGKVPDAVASRQARCQFPPRSRRNGNLIETWQGLQELPIVGIRRQAASIRDRHPGSLPFGFQRADRLAKVFQHAAMTESQFAVEGWCEDFVFSSQTAFGCRSGSCSIGVPSIRPSLASLGLRPRCGPRRPRRVGGRLVEDFMQPVFSPAQVCETFCR